MPPHQIECVRPKEIVLRHNADHSKGGIHQALKTAATIRPLCPRVNTGNPAALEGIIIIHLRG